MQDYYDLMHLPAEAADLLVGEIIEFERYKHRVSLIVHLDEFTASRLATQYSVIQVWKYQDFGQRKYPTTLDVFLPGIDDFNFKATFEPSKTLHLSSLIQLVQHWAARSNYRHINVHALEDYCLWLGAYDIDWN